MNVATERKILVVEDEEYSQDILQQYLEDSGFVVSIATSKSEALQLLEGKQEFDMILVDRVLSSMDGLDLIRQLRSQDRFKNLPIVIESALAMPEQVLEGLEAGANYYLTKPFSLPLLAEAVNSALELNISNDNSAASKYFDSGCTCGQLWRSFKRVSSF